MSGDRSHEGSGEEEGHEKTMNPPQGANINRTGLVEAGRRIEEESFRIIDAEMGDHSFTPDQWLVVRRVIHTTGDFDYANWMRFHPRGVAAGIEALKRGAEIFTDTRMIQVGLSPWRLQWFRNAVVTPATHADSQEWAVKMGDHPVCGRIQALCISVQWRHSGHRERSHSAAGGFSAHQG